jgi:UDP-3-O-[3-hydroxymyristoyl] glucosamine N-acyltransferase
MPAAGYTLAELAGRCGGEVRGDGSVRLQAVATLQNAGPGSIAFLANPHYKRFVADSRASALILSADDAKDCALPALVTPNPYLVYARVAALLAPEPSVRGGIDPGAHVSAGAKVSADAWVAPGAVVEEGAEIGPRVFIGPNCVVRHDARIGADSRLVANVYLGPRSQVGQRVILHPNCAIGGDGFGNARDGERWVKVPQLGAVRIGDDVEIGCNTSIDRGALEDTVIEEGVRIDNQIQVGHGSRIGAHTAIAGGVIIAGSANIGKRCMIAGGAGVNGHMEVCDDVVIIAMTMVTRAITKPGVYGGGLPMDSVENWRKNAARFRQLDAMARRIAELEKKLKD